MSMGLLTPIQIRDKKINDLKIQLSNEKNARKYDKELFEYKYAELKDIIAQKQEVIEMLQREISSLTIENNEKEEENEALKKRIAELEDKVAVLESRIKKDSSNSSKPPSSDGFKKPKTFSTREKSGKRPGGQVGHTGHTIKVDAIETEVIERKEGSCPCGGEIEFGANYQSRRIVDVHVTLSVKEERAYSGKCKVCGEHFQAAKKLKDERMASGQNCLTPEEIAQWEQEYIAILDEGDKEYEAAIEGKKNIRRFHDEYCLLVRLRKYKDEHLRFLSNFDVPFGNWIAEHGAHFMKNKTRVAGGFRSSQGADNHMAIASVIATAKKQKKNIFSVIKKFLNGEAPFDGG